MRAIHFLRVAAALLALAHAAGAAAQPRVVASIAPLHSLVAGVMEGIGAPQLLVQGAASPHAYALRPSEARALSRAEVVFWVGPAYEEFLRKPLVALASKAKVVEAARAPGVVVLPVREGGAWSHGHGHAHGKADRAADGHLFLDPHNAIAIVHAISATLAESDPVHRGRYAANAERLALRLEALDAELREHLAPVRAAPFVVFHDAYQYFERRYGLNAVGSITVSPDRAPGAQRLRELRRTIAARKALCVFSEPQFAPGVVRTVVEGTPARTAVLDPLGAGLEPGAQAYFELLRGLARALRGCLDG